MTNLTDITDLTDAALDVFLAVKAGKECVTVEHLTPAERLAVCAALEIKTTARVARPLVVSFTLRGGRVVDAVRVDD